MLEWAGAVLGFVGAAAASVAYRGYRCRVHGRRYALSAGPHGDVLASELGELRVDKAAGRLQLQRKGGAPAWIALSDVRGVQVRVGSKQALGEELLFEGVGVLDLVSDDYRDRRVTWDVVLVTAHGLVPVAHLSQYQVNDWFDFATPIQVAILRKLGKYELGQDVAARIEADLRALLRRAGLAIRGGHDAGLPTGALDGGLLPRPPVRATPGPIEIPTTPDAGPAGWPAAEGGPKWPDASGRG
jgi:hypothetical protein